MERVDEAGREPGGSSQDRPEGPAGGGPFDRMRDWRYVVETSRAGFPVQVVDALVETDRLTAAEVDHLVLPMDALSERRRSGRLSAAESDRLVRVLDVLLAAETTFGSQPKAAEWLRRGSALLDGHSPIALLDTNRGSREVERALGRIDHGIAA